MVSDDQSIKATLLFIVDKTEYPRQSGLCAKHYAYALNHYLILKTTLSSGGCPYPHQIASYTESLSDLPKITQLLNDGAGFKTRLVKYLGPLL